MAEDSLLREVERLSLGRALIVVSNLTHFSGPALIAADIAEVLRAHGVAVTLAARHVSPAMEEAVPALRGAVALHADPRPVMGGAWDLVLTQSWQSAAFALLECGINLRHLVCGSFSASAAGETLAGLTPLADAILYASDWVARMQPPPAGMPAVCYRNALPRRWHGAAVPPQAVRRVAFVTNHPSAAYEDMAARLRAAGLDVARLGRGVEAALVDADFLDAQDAVVTVGHSVQKALARMRPAFVCGPLGAPGWVMPENFAAGEAVHFCGVNGPRHDGQALAGAFLAGAAAALQAAPALHALAAARMVTEERLLALLRAMPRRDMARGFGGAPHWPLRRLAQMVMAADTATRFFPDAYMADPPAVPLVFRVSAVAIPSAEVYDLPSLAAVPLAFVAAGTCQPRVRFRLRRMGRWPDVRFTLQGPGIAAIPLAARATVAFARGQPRREITTFDVAMAAAVPAVAGELTVSMQAEGEGGDAAPFPVLRLRLEV